jgi:hypothetical protein
MWPARRAGNLRPSSTPLDTPRRMPMLGALCEDQLMDSNFGQNINDIISGESGADRNFPCPTLKIRKVSIVVMGS